MTWSSSNRLEQHSAGLGSKYTTKHGFKRLVYLEEFEDFEAARYREKQIKGWRRKKKERLIKGEWKQFW